MLPQCYIVFLTFSVHPEVWKEKLEYLPLEWGSRSSNGRRQPWIWDRQIVPKCP